MRKDWNRKRWEHEIKSDEYVTREWVEKWQQGIECMRKSERWTIDLEDDLEYLDGLRGRNYFQAMKWEWKWQLYENEKEGGRQGGESDLKDDWEYLDGCGGRNYFHNMKWEWEREFLLVEGREGGEGDLKDDWEYLDGCRGRKLYHGITWDWNYDFIRMCKWEK